MFIYKCLTWLPGQLADMLRSDPARFWLEVPTVLGAVGVILWCLLPEVLPAWIAAALTMMVVVILTVGHLGDDVSYLDAEIERFFAEQRNPPAS